jgi:hypothetical protein
MILRFHCGILLDVRTGSAFERCHTVQVSQDQQLDAVGIQYLQALRAGVYFLVENGYLFPSPPHRKSNYFPLKQRDFRAILPTTK